VVALAIPATLEAAVMVTGPPTATPVTGTFVEEVFGAMVTVPGTLAKAGLLEVRLTVTPP